MGADDDWPAPRPQRFDEAQPAEHPAYPRDFEVGDEAPGHAVVAFEIRQRTQALVENDGDSQADADPAVGLDVPGSHRLLDAKQVAIERSQVVQRAIRCVGPEVVGIDTHPVTGHAVPPGQLGDAAELLPVDLQVAFQLHLEVRQPEDTVLNDQKARLPRLVVAEHRRVHVGPARRCQTEQRLDALPALTGEEVEQRTLDGAPRRRRCVDGGGVLREPDPERIEADAVGLDRLLPCAQPLPARSPRLPSHVLAGTTLAVTPMCAARSLDPQALTVRPRGGRVTEGHFERDPKLG